MRRKDREVTEPEAIEAIIAAAQVCHLAMADGQAPYVVPLSFGYLPGRLYFHSAPQGRKLDILQRNPAVCFSLVAEAEILAAGTPCGWSLRYASVIGNGRAAWVTSDDEKREALDAIVAHYGGGEGHSYAPASLARVAILRVDIESLSGKHANK
jgi:nitroimidazol reductase NimA-like FMN-containing flavoprotein (pyridoxamine 5'-phosphate oxidase superfamily)